MRRWKVGVLCGAALLAFGLAAPRAAQAADVTFWFADALDPTGTPISSLLIGDIGSAFTVSVWYQSETALPHNALNVFVGFDQTDTTGPAATPFDNVIGLSGDVFSSLTDIGPDFTLGTPALGGGQDIDPAFRPFGIDVPMEGPLGLFLTGEEPTKLFDLSMSNLALFQDSNYDLVLWDGGTGEDYTSYLLGDTDLARPEIQAFLTLFRGTVATPEPGTVGLLALGLTAALFLIRRGQADGRSTRMPGK